jgi:hypothetical protein
MDGITVEVTNAAAFDAMLRQINDDVTHPAGPSTAAGRSLISEAGPTAPRRTGRLAGAATVTPHGPGGARITVNVPYAAPVHWGWPGHGISRQPWLVATWLRDRKPLDTMTDAVQADIDKAAAKTR